jgi:deferrochelatase/peroxidase EfeB
MRKDVINKSATLGSTSDLTVYAPIKEGFIGSLDAVTYKTRVKRVLNTLHLGRRSSHEYDLFRAMSDAVERVGRIHSIRIAILERDHPQGRDHVMLAVTFDGSWESYIRTIWQKVSNSLDLIFCNTEEYVCGGTSTFEEWDRWLRGRQAESSFFYSPPGLTYEDTQYLAVHERFSRGISDADERDSETSSFQLLDAQQITERIVVSGRHPYRVPGSSRPPTTPSLAFPEFYRQGVRGTATLYRLADWYLPGTCDGKILHRAAVELLGEFYRIVKDNENKEGPYNDAYQVAESRFPDALRWLKDTPCKPRVIPGPPEQLGLSNADLADVQAGILEPIKGLESGCMAFLSCESADAFGKLLGALKATPHGDPSLAEASLCATVSLTAQAFYLAGYSDEEMAQLPAEFVQGMERRAGLLGDVRQNHPRRWRQPALNGHAALKDQNETQDAAGERIELAQVHVVLQLRAHRGSSKGMSAPDRDAIADRLQKLLQNADGTRLLGVQWMHVLRRTDGRPKDHFGYIDGDGVSSQPAYAAADKGEEYPNLVHAGEVLRGYANAADMAPGDKATDMVKLLKNGSFLVVRKLRQHVDRLEAALIKAMEANGVGAADQAETRKLYLNKMMGRVHGDETKDPGAALVVRPVVTNDFSFELDRSAGECPFHAHIRLANPRRGISPNAAPGERPPRIVRRSMSYGLAVNLDDPESVAEPRGMLFMAYNASIGEQFEVIQRWLTGGNSSGSYSGESDPFVGVAESGAQRCFKFLNGEDVVRVGLDGASELGQDPKAFVELEWGAYLFTPGIASLVAMAKRASQSSMRLSWSVTEGRKEITRLRDIEATQGHNAALQAWKTVLEDPDRSADYTSASVWAAIRADHGGVLKTPFGVLVGSRKLVDQVTKNEKDLTITEFLPRMRRSFGELYLGLDGDQPDGRYEKEAEAANAAVMALAAPLANYQSTRQAAEDATLAAIDKLVQMAIDNAKSSGEAQWDLSIDAREIIDTVLADLCEQFFGLSEHGEYLKRGSAIWDDKGTAKPRYPGHFMAPSRYVFQPHPGPDVKRIASAQGQALSRAMTEYLADPNIGPTITAPVARAVLDSAAAKADPSYAARTLAGILMGFVPTLDGNMRRILVEWAREGSLWTLRSSHQRDLAAGVPLDKSGAPALLRQYLHKTLQLRAAPEQLWRTAVTTHRMGEREHVVTLDPGDVVVAGLISANHECLESGDPALHYAFGGKRQHPVQQPPQEPRHACPGAGPALAVLEGFLRGLMVCKQPLRPGPTGLSFQISGRIEQASDESGSSFVAISYSTFTLTKPTQTQEVPAAVMGDSWLTLHRPWDAAPMLIDQLVDMGIVQIANSDTSYTDDGQKLDDMVKSKLDSFVKEIKVALKGKAAPKLILLDGGGNDLVHPTDSPMQTVLYAVLREAIENAGEAPVAINPAQNKALNNFLDQLKTNYTTSCQKLIEATGSLKIPILIHGYDYPSVSGDKYVNPYLSKIERGPWLKGSFDAAGFPADMSQRNGVMRSLIDALNLAIQSVANKFPDRVHHIDLRGTFENAEKAEAPNPYDASDPNTYGKYWANELHPNEHGCSLHAAIYRSKLICLKILPKPVPGISISGAKGLQIN